MNLKGLGVDNIIFNNKGIDTISQIANYKTVVNIFARNSMPLEDDIKHTPISPYIGKIQDQLIYDDKKRYKINDFKPIIQYAKISKGIGLSNYIIIIKNIPTLFDYATNQKKAKDTFCMLIYSGLHQPTKQVSSHSMKFISKMLKRKTFKLHSIDLASDFIDKKPIDYNRKDEVKKKLKSHTEPKSYHLQGSSLYCNKTKDMTVKKILIYDKYYKQTIYHKQVIQSNLKGWKRLEVELRPSKKQNFKTFINSEEFKKSSLKVYDLLSMKLGLFKMDNSYLNYQVSTILDNRQMNNKKSKKQYNSKESLSRFKMSELKLFEV